MRNLKRALSLGLTAAMISGLMVMGSSAASYADVTSEDNVEAIEVLQAVGIMVGDENGDFNPDQNVTRNEMAVIMSNLMEYNVASYKGTSPFTDVPSWAEPYVAACWTNGITAGTSATTYGGSDSVTTAQAALMLMKALGYFQYASDFGADWQLSAVRQGNAIDLFNGVDSGVEEAMTRNDVAQLVLNTLQSGMVEASTNGSLTIGDVTIATNVTYNYITSNSSYASAISSDRSTNTTTDATQAIVELGEDLYQGDLRLADNTSDEFERPSRTWSYDGAEIGTYAKRELQIASYTTGVSGRDLYNLLSSATIRDNDLYYYVDGAEDDTTITAENMTRSHTDDYDTTGRGVLTEVYLDDDRDEITIVSINTYLAQANADYSTSTEYAPLSVYVEDDGTPTTYNVDVEVVPAVEDVVDEDYYLVNISYKDITRGEVVDIQNATVMEDSTVTKWSSSTDNVVRRLTVDGTEYEASKKAFYDVDTLEDYDLDLLTDMSYNVYLDQYGYVIGVDLYEGTMHYVFITGYDRPTSNLSIRTADAGAIFLDGTMDVIEVNVSATNDNIEGVDGYSEWNSNTTNFRDGKYNENRWYSYTVNNSGVYTLKPVNMTATWYEDVPNSEFADTIKTDNVYLDNDYVGFTNERVYGEDESVYLTVEKDEVDTTNSHDWAITDVTGVYTGVQNVTLDVYDCVAAGNDYSIYTVYNDDYYIIGAIVLGEAQGNTSDIAYVLSEAKSEEYVDGTYYWEFDAIVNGEIQTLTAMSEYSRTIDILEGEMTGYIGNSAYSGEDDRLVELRFDGDYVTSIRDVTSIYENYENPINGEDVYYITNADALTLRGRTLYVTADRDDVGLALVTDAPAVTIQDENGETNVETEFSSVSAAIAHLYENGEDFDGIIVAALNSDGAAEWIVFDSSNPLNTGSTSTVITRGALKLTDLSYDSTVKAYKVDFEVTKAIKGSDHYTVEITTVNGAQVASATKDFLNAGTDGYDWSVGDTATLSIESVQKQADELNVKVTFYDEDGRELTSAEAFLAS